MFLYSRYPEIDRRELVFCADLKIFEIFQHDFRACNMRHAEIILNNLHDRQNPNRLNFSLRDMSAVVQ
ncbi:MAG TPA: hypothetical protein DIW81_03725 [Planctomycetaceae bacterium]|nr:hypothetical protein [Rubinisphaera sp.]HCS50691.1 hypothetical protein [Planctomycetaceae bacterium]